MEELMLNEIKKELDFKERIIVKLNRRLVIKICRITACKITNCYLK